MAPLSSIFADPPEIIHNLFWQIVIVLFLVVVNWGIGYLGAKDSFTIRVITFFLNFGAVCLIIATTIEAVVLVTIRTLRVIRNLIREIGNGDAVILSV